MADEHSRQLLAAVRQANGVPAMVAAVLRTTAEFVNLGPEVPLPPSVYSTLLCEYADDVESGAVSIASTMTIPRELVEASPVSAIALAEQYHADAAEHGEHAVDAARAVFTTAAVFEGRARTIGAALRAVANLADNAPQLTRAAASMANRLRMIAAAIEAEYGTERQHLTPPDSGEQVVTHGTRVLVYPGPLRGHGKTTANRNHGVGRITWTSTNLDPTKTRYGVTMEPPYDGTSEVLHGDFEVLPELHTLEVELEGFTAAEVGEHLAVEFDLDRDRVRESVAARFGETLPELVPGEQPIESTSVVPAKRTAAEKLAALKQVEHAGYVRHRDALRQVLGEHGTDTSLMGHITEDVRHVVDLVDVLRKATGARVPDKGGMTAGEAVDALRQGHRVTRTPWMYAGQGPYLFLVPGSQFAVAADRPLGAADPSMVGRTVSYVEHIDQSDGHDFVRVWAPKTEDVLATDWRIVPRPDVDDTNSTTS